ncbi:MAG: HEPN domain-containing protein [Candidatus Parvarchaeota archaeon]|nr:HEPN domain-containing protein [Candidatus Jingweiarchaeum tengchongense]
MAERANDWLRQAERDLRHAENSLRDGDYEWACFASQQAAEKALKAVYEKMNMVGRGHSILGLLKGLSFHHEVPDQFYRYARILSRYYIEARYPNGFPEGAPSDYFDEDIAKEAIDAAKALVQWSRSIVVG